MGPKPFRWSAVAWASVILLATASPIQAGWYDIFGEDFTAGAPDASWLGFCGVWTVHDVVAGNVEPLAWNELEGCYDDRTTSGPDGGKIGPMVWPGCVGNVGGGGVAIQFDPYLELVGRTVAGLELWIGTGDSDVEAVVSVGGDEKYSAVFPALYSGLIHKFLGPTPETIWLSLLPNPDTPDLVEADFTFDYVVWPEPATLSLLALGAAALLRRRA